jgi:hypothetical protein
VPKRKVVPYISNYPYETFGKIWTSERSPIQISKCGCLKILINKKMPGPTCQSQAPLKKGPDAGVVHARQLLGHSHHLAPALSTGHHVRSTRNACSRRSVRLLLTLSVRKRSLFSPLPATATEHPPTSLCLSPFAFAPSVERWPPRTALVHL